MRLFRPFFTTALIILILPSICYSKAGPPIPVPLVSAEEAIKLVKKDFAKQTVNLKNQEYFSEFILLSVAYRSDKHKDSDEWYWELTFVHPRDNDCSWVYMVNNHKEVTLLYTTK